LVLYLLHGLVHAASFFQFGYASFDGGFVKGLRQSTSIKVKGRSEHLSKPSDWDYVGPNGNEATCCAHFVGTNEKGRSGETSMIRLSTMLVGTLFFATPLLAETPCDFKGVSVGSSMSPVEIMSALGVSQYETNPSDL
jgi:hypothetical protein